MLSIVSGEEYWLTYFFTGNYLDFISHTHLLIEYDKASKDCYVDQDILHLGTLIIGELHQLL